MKKTSEAARPLRDVVKELLQHILEALPMGCASLQIETIKRGYDFCSLLLVPTNENSATFGVTLLEDSLYSIDFGKAPAFTTFECPWEIHLSRSAPLEQQVNVMRQMCLAVIAGKCEHRFEPRSIRGEIYVNEKEVYRVADIHIIRLFWPRKNRHVVRYAPYFPDAERHIQSTLTTIAIIRNN